MVGKKTKRKRKQNKTKTGRPVLYYSDFLKHDTGTITGDYRIQDCNKE